MMFIIDIQRRASEYIAKIEHLCNSKTVEIGHNWLLEKM